jgi:hypothetical protein
MDQVKNTTPYIDQNNEIGLADIIKEIKFWKKLVIRNIIKFLAFSIIIGLIGFLYAYTSKPFYNAKLKFVMKSDPAGISSGLSGLSSLLGSGTNSGGSLERILELIGSNSIIGKALLTQAEVNGENDLLVNHYIKIENFHEAWKKDTALNKITFNSSVSIDSLDLSHRRALRRLVRTLIGGEVLLEEAKISKSFDKKSGVVTLAVKSINEGFAIEMTKSIYKMLIAFYLDQSLSTPRNNVSVLMAKSDSIKRELDAVRLRYAEKTDQGLGLLLQQDQVLNKSLAYKENMLSIMYGEVQKNLETLRYIEASSMPSFTILDQPFSPITPIKPKTYLWTPIGFFIGFVFLFVFLRLKLYFSSILKNT